MRLSSIAILAALLAATPPAAHAAATTSSGQISVAQVIEMTTLAGSDPRARMTLIAYLAGVGEATGIMATEAQNRGAKALHCRASFSLDDNAALAAVSAAVPDRAKWTETAATPIIIADMFRRADCR